VNNREVSLTKEHKELESELEKQNELISKTYNIFIINLNYIFFLER